MPRFLSLILLVALLAACNGEGGDTPTTTAPDSTTTTAAEATTTTAPAANTTTTSSPSTAGGGSDCLVGTWVLDNEAFIASMGQIFADAGMADADISPLGGTFTAEFAADGSLNAERDGWGFEIGAQGSVFRIEVSGTETGTWSADDTTLTVNTDVSELISNASIVVDGQELELPPGMQAPQVPETIASESEYTCDGDVLTITNESVTSTFNRA